MTPLSAALDAATGSIELTADALERAAVAPRRAEAMADVEVGETPSEVVYAENKLELHQYDAEAAGIEPAEPVDVPLLIVYALINRPYVLDLQPSRSVVRRLLEAGFDVYLIDWGEPSLLDASLGLDDYVGRYVDNCVDVVRERSELDSINLLGYCMGGTMAAMYAAIRPEKVRNLGLMAAGLCFAGQGGVLERWGADEHFDPGAVADAYGTIPAEFFQVGFDLMDPVENTVSKYVRLYENLEDEEFVENFARMERWLAEGIDMAGATFREFIEAVYQENALMDGGLTVGGERVDPGAIDAPVLQIVAEYDHLVPPEASVPFNDAVGSEEADVMAVSAGHVGLSVSSRAHDELWPDVAAWFAERSAAEPEPSLRDVEGIGPTYAGRLREAGVETLDDLAAADPAALAEGIDVGQGRVANWVERAAEIAG